MKLTTREPSVLGDARERIDSSTERAGDILGLIAERAQDAIETAGVEPHALRAGAARAVAGAPEREFQCQPEVQAAADRLRLKVAIITGLVAFGLSLVVLLAARAVARRAQQGSAGGQVTDEPGPDRPKPLRPGTDPEA